MTRSLKSVSCATRVRCCMSATSGSATKLPCPGLTSAKIDAVTVSIKPIDTVISISEKPCSREWRRISLPFAFSRR